ncbi:uncharacterized protein LODBEIA_P49360 [Lodderomyces beijingensis]|uniref:Potassium channel domain-containing protein n=1 Tax=Lodderomyces beijingensis TaxID=1775926 RepID=A0ABP0ZVP8_9ASCO
MSEAPGQTPSLLRRATTMLKRARTVLQPTHPIIPKLDESHEELLSPLLVDTKATSVSKRFMVSSSLDVPMVVLNLNVRPGERHFVTWFIISSYFPLIAACLGPLANMISIVALIQHWRQDKVTGELLPDPRHVMVLNGLSLALGVLGNISLLMNFSRSVKYLITQCISICCWFCASMLLVAAMLITRYREMGTSSSLALSEGFYFACFTAGYYFSCMIILLVNFAGYKLKKYPATFNLDQKQRTLMFYTILFAMWAVAGAVSMSHLIKDLTYGSSLYYCIVSFLTVGLGDILPETAAAKAMALVFSLGGVLIMGLIIATLRSVILASASPAIIWDATEVARIKCLCELKRENRRLSPDDSYQKMRRIRHHVHKKHNTFSSILTILVFISFWLIGGLIFHYVEHWSCYNAFYFCSLCLLTIGYGDFAPSTRLGRCFFVSWAITAVPMMTILISSVGDSLYSGINSFSAIFTNFMIPIDANGELNKLLNRQAKEEENENQVGMNGLSRVEEDLLKLEGDDEAEDEAASHGIHRLSYDSTSETANSTSVGVNKIRRRLVRQKSSHEQLLGYLERLKPLISDGIQSPDKKYTFQEWNTAYKTLELKKVPDDVEMEDYGGFWLGQYSPLRLPLKEPNYLMLRVYYKIEESLATIVESERQELQSINELEDDRPRAKDSKPV